MVLGVWAEISRKLSNRKKSVKFGKIQSEEMSITSGSPQRSVLGPISFVL